MEQNPENIELYTIRWHGNVKKDVKNVPRHELESIAAHSKHILGQVPYLAGEQIKGKGSTLRRIKHGAYRIIFTVIGRDVWILSVEHRKMVYRPEHVISLIRLGLMLQGK